MVRHDGAEARKERIANIATFIQAALYQNKTAGYIPLKRTVALIELETGLTKEKIFAILSLLQEAGKFESDHEKDQIRRFAEGV